MYHVYDLRDEKAIDFDFSKTVENYIMYCIAS